MRFAAYYHWVNIYVPSGHSMFTYFLYLQVITVEIKNEAALVQLQHSTPLAK